MRYSIFTLAFMLVVAGHHTTLAQDPGDADAIKISTGGSFAKLKITTHLEKLGIAQLTVNYKLTSTARNAGKDKSSGKVAAAKLTAYLETTDGELTDDDFQEVTDYCYAYFQKKLKENGIDTVAWSAITATDFYKAADERTESNDEEKGNGQVWVTYNAHKGNILYAGKTAFAFGKIKKASRFCGDIDAPAGFFHITLDFADLMVNVDIKSSEPSYPSGYFPYTRTTTFKYSAATKPVMRIVPSTLGMSMLWNEKSQNESVVVSGNIDCDMPYHTALNQDPSRIKNRAFAFAKSMDPVVVETTRAQYKAAAKKALEKYVDAYIAKVIELKKG